MRNQSKQATRNVLVLQASPNRTKKSESRALEKIGTQRRSVATYSQHSVQSFSRRALYRQGKLAYGPKPENGFAKEKWRRESPPSSCPPTSAHVHKVPIPSAQIDKLFPLVAIDGHHYPPHIVGSNVVEMASFGKDFASMKPIGRHPVNRLTALTVRTEKRPGRHADGGGLYLEVDANGTKRWTLRTIVQSRRRDIGLGSAALVSLADARDLARDMRKIARSGGDPLAARNQLRHRAPTFEAAARQIHGDRQNGWRNAKHRGQWLNTLTTYAFPVIGGTPVNKIETPHVLSVLAPIWQAKPETARRVKQRIRAVLDWATAAGHRQGENPVVGVTKGLGGQNDRPQHHSAMLPSDVPNFIADLRRADAGQIVKLALEFLILTACRTGEVLKADWAEFDLNGALWTIPAERMKGKRPHRVPLSERALEILADARKLSGSTGLVFPGRKRGAPLSQMALLQLMRRMGRTEVPHGFRSTFRDWAAERTPFPREVAEAALAHTVKDKVERAYARTDHLERRRELMATWAAWCVPASGNVVTVRAG